MLILLLVLGGGLTTTAAVLTALSFSGALLWHRSFRSTIGKWQWRAEIILFYFGLLFLVSYLNTSTPNVGLNEVISMLFGIVLFLGASRSFSNAKHLQIFLKYITIIALLGACYGVILYVFAAYNRFSGPFVDLTSFAGFFPNAWFDFVLLTIPCTAFMSLYQSFSKKEHILGAITFTLLCTSMVLSYSRGGFLSLGVEIGFGLLITFFVFKDSLPNLSRKIVTLVGLFMMSIALALCLNFFRTENGYQVQSWYQKASLQSDDQSASVNEREGFFAASVKLIEEKPWFGYGPYSFRYVFPRYQQDLLALSDHPHNILLKIAVENGLLTLTFFLIFAFITFVVFVQGLRQHDKEKALLTRIVGISLLGVFSHNLIDYNFNFLSIMLLSWTFLGILFALHPGIKGQQRSISGTVTIVIVMIGAVIGVHELIYGYDLSKARSLDKLSTSEAIRTRIGYYEQALSLWQTRDLMAVLAKDYLLSGDLDAAEKLLQGEAPKHPHFAELWYLWGDVLRQKNDLQNAKENFQMAIDQDPVNELRYYLGMFQTVVALGDQLEVEKWKKIVEPLLSTYTQKLRTNQHFTVMTLNPMAAAELYTLLQLPEKAAEIQQIYKEEMKKLENPKTL